MLLPPKARPRLDTLDDYEQYLAATLEGWSSDQRTAFAEQEGWGDPDAVRSSVDAAWMHVIGRA